ncbi:hypothetical protein NL676_037750 [Syzygium grande]|nr:hypothetical protein NL676_037750 [Syzygium grande]
MYLRALRIIMFGLRQFTNGETTLHLHSCPVSVVVAATLSATAETHPLSSIPTARVKLRAWKSPIESHSISSCIYIILVIGAPNKQPEGFWLSVLDPSSAGFELQAARFGG